MDENFPSIRLVDMNAAANTEEAMQMEISEKQPIDDIAANTEIQNEPEAVAEEAVKETAKCTPSPDLLMYLAKRNVKLRYNLIYHIVLFPVSFIVLYIITGGFRGGGPNASFYSGFFFAWGILILHKCYVVIQAWFAARPKIQKKDLIEAEYERLKNAAPEKIEI